MDVCGAVRDASAAGDVEWLVAWRGGATFLPSALRCCDASSGRGALHYAAEHASAALIIRTLLTLGAPVNATDSAGSTPLHIAVATGNATATIALLDGGADPTAADGNGSTVTELAKGNPAVLTPLLSHLLQVGVVGGSTAPRQDTPPPPPPPPPPPTLPDEAVEGTALLQNVARSVRVMERSQAELAGEVAALRAEVGRGGGGGASLSVLQEETRGMQTVLESLGRYVVDLQTRSDENTQRFARELSGVRHDNEEIKQTLEALSKYVVEGHLSLACTQASRTHPTPRLPVIERDELEKELNKLKQNNPSADPVYLAVSPSSSASSSVSTSVASPAVHYETPQNLHLPLSGKETVKEEPRGPITPNPNREYNAESETPNIKSDQCTYHSSPQTWRGGVSPLHEGPGVWTLEARIAARQAEIDAAQASEGDEVDPAALLAQREQERIKHNRELLQEAMTMAEAASSRDLAEHVKRCESRERRHETLKSIRQEKETKISDLRAASVQRSDEAGRIEVKRAFEKDKVRLSQEYPDLLEGTIDKKKALLMDGMAKEIREAEQREQRATRPRPPPSDRTHQNGPSSQVSSPSVVAAPSSTPSTSSRAGSEAGAHQPLSKRPPIGAVESAAGCSENSEGDGGGGGGVGSDQQGAPQLCPDLPSSGCAASSRKVFLTRREKMAKVELPTL